MRLTCPFCQSEAKLKPNPAQAQRRSLPRYLLTCTGCDRTSVRVEPEYVPQLALVELKSA